MFKEKNIKKNKFFSKNTCKIRRSVLEFNRSGKKWYKVVQSGVKFNYVDG